MSNVRAGQLSCQCGEELLAGTVLPATGLPDATREVLLLAGGFGLSTLAQAFALTALPYGATMLAPSPVWVGAPYAIWLVGALFATFPASILDGLFGRRAAFGLGASIGFAGGVLAAWSFVAGQFPALMLGAFWLGLAQGFGLFYRHAAAQTHRPMALTALFGAGALAVLAAPFLMSLVPERLLPLAPAFMFAGAGLASMAALGAALALPIQSTRQPSREVIPIAEAKSLDTAAFVGVTLCAGASWFVMTLLMGASPSLLAGCGYGFGTASGLIAWHMLAMYLPASLLAPWSRKIAPLPLMATGLLLLAAALLCVKAWQGLVPITAALTLGGVGWSLVSLASMASLHAGNLNRTRMASHDAALFASAIAGALARGLV